MKPRVMVVDDEKINRISLCAQMEDAGFEVAAFDSPFPALERLRREEWDVVVTDLRMPLLDGVSFLKEIRKIRPETEVLVMTAYGSVESAVEAMKSGAFDYVTKPYQWEEMEVRLRRMLSHRKVSQEVVRLRRELEDRDRFHGIVGNSPAMRKVFERIRGASDAVHPVLVVGETGTGKEMVADAIQRTGSRREAPYIKTSCSTLSREVIESELFGHEAGAFTGAVRQRRGRFELADGGTLLLDDIDDVPMDLQVKLLRVLQDGRFERVGGETTLSVDVRVVATAKARLEDLVAAGK
ncbi:MAG: sigma-54-dependent Fis family transcriptional regulator, partial [Planctomycetes bacterium]|nr:sigma-54-dependent Fis family transcriptional regulator [Planctomycetota bacterium]